MFALYCKKDRFRLNQLLVCLPTFCRFSQTVLALFFDMTAEDMKGERERERGGYRGDQTSASHMRPGKSTSVEFTMGLICSLWPGL